MGFVAAYLRAQVGLVIFCDLAGYGGGAGPHDGVDQVAADGVGHVLSGGIADVCSAVADGTAGCGVGDTVGIHYALHCRPVTDLAGDAVGRLVDQGFRIIGDSAVLSSVGDVRFCLFRTGQNIAVAILNFLENLLQVLGDVRFVVISSILAGNYRAGFRCRLGGHVGLIPVFYGIGHGVLVVCPLAHGAFCIHRRIVPGT